MIELASLLATFKWASGCEAAVWTSRAGAVVRDAATADIPQPRLPNIAEGIVTLDGGAALIAAIPGPRNSWLQVGPTTRDADLKRQMEFLLPVVAQRIQSALEVEHAATELAERYEEINLLYTISEILGRTVDLGEAANRILAEISETVGARKAAVQVYDAASRSLLTVAALGVPASTVERISIDDPQSVSARAFRSGHASIVAGNEMMSEAERPFRHGAMLSVPILWTTPRSVPEPLGVVNLSDRRNGAPFSAGDQKLISAIATQIGTAIQNSRLVTESLRQQRLVQEMQLAHDLQMRLLPDVSAVAPNATVGARVVPAESVGGDLYNLFRLGAGKSGVMVGDVSGHGLQAALIMALTMSAAAIHSQGSTDPGETLNQLLHSLADELVAAEMFVSLFYGVVDRPAKLIHYANAGHPHAFVISGGGSAHRLPALDPPLGMGQQSPRAVSRPWSEDDLLLVFTDGVTDARDAAGNRLGEDRVVELARQHRTDAPSEIVDRILDMVNTHAANAPRRDDLTIVALRS